MKGDFSRDTFHRQHHFSRVLMQQGRVLLDADWNEQTSILLHYLRTLAADLIGPHGGPDEGFEITCSDERPCDFMIGRGHYYVDGILCENVPVLPCPPDNLAPPLTYNSQPDYPLQEGDEAKLQNNTAYLVYLDVWERHLSHLQAPHIREPALGGPDTATRARIICQAKAAEVPKDTPEAASCEELLSKLLPDGYRCLRARALVDNSSDDPCIIPPDARFRGAENQLYRVEIHQAGTAGTAKTGASFKWSRDNGSVVFAIRSLQGSIAGLETLGPDLQHSLKEGDWVEIVDDISVLRFSPRPLAKVLAVDRVNVEVTLELAEGISTVFDENSTTHPLLRRWDQETGSIPVQEGRWLDLEDGVQVYFEPGGTYRTGDYWIIPARTATGNVLWPTEAGPDGAASPQPVPPEGIAHHYAPLARIKLDGNGRVSCLEDCRCSFTPLCGAVATVEPPSHETIVSQIRFKMNSATITEAAREQLRASTQRLNSLLSRDTKLHAEVRGYATRDETSPNELAKERASRVMEAYLEGGIDRARLQARALEATDTPDTPKEELRRVDTVLLPTVAKPPSEAFPVHEIEGVGETFALRMGAAGITKAADVARLKPAELATILTPQGGRAVTENRALAIIEEAKRLLRTGGE